MESQQDDAQSQEIESFISEKAINYILSGIIILALIGFLMFRTTSVELTCDRSSPHSIACSLVRISPILRMNPIKIIDPQAVDLITHRHRGTYSYSAEIRPAHVSYTIPILSDYNYELVRGAADKVNDFLLRTDAASFFARFPEKTR